MTTKLVRDSHRASYDNMQVYRVACAISTDHKVIYYLIFYISLLFERVFISTYII